MQTVGTARDATREKSERSHREVGFDPIKKEKGPLGAQSVQHGRSRQGQERTLRTREDQVRDKPRSHNKPCIKDLGGILGGR